MFKLDAIAAAASVSPLRTPAIHQVVPNAQHMELEVDTAPARRPTRQKRQGAAGKRRDAEEDREDSQGVSRETDEP